MEAKEMSGALESSLMDPLRPYLFPVEEFYRRLNDYIFMVGLPWDLSDWQADIVEEAKYLKNLFGEGAGRRALDAACGWGRQTLALAQLGWQVTAVDANESSLGVAQERAAQLGLAVDFRRADLRWLAKAGLGGGASGGFDLIVSAYGLYEITVDDEIKQALSGLAGSLADGGRCFLVQRDMDTVWNEKPRYEFHGERRGDGWRVICIEDWIFESETHVQEVFAFLREDEQYTDWRRWTSEVIGIRKRLIRKRELAAWLEDAGFRQVNFLAQESPWHPVEIVAEK